MGHRVSGTCRPTTPNLNGGCSTCSPARGCKPNQRVTFLTDGGEDIRELPRYLNPQAEHLLDWFHLTMRITVMMQLAKGLRVSPELSATLAAELQRLKWFLWHGNVFRSLQTVDDITTDLEDEDTGGQQDKDRHDKTRQGGTRVRRVPRRERLGHIQLRGALPRLARSSPLRSWNPRSTR